MGLVTSTELALQLKVQALELQIQRLESDFKRGTSIIEIQQQSLGNLTECIEVIHTRLGTQGQRIRDCYHEMDHLREDVQKLNTTFFEGE